MCFRTYWNNDYFSIERSENGADFYKVGIVGGNGNSASLNHYSWVDSAPLSGTAYYRISQTDFDGEITYYSGIAARCADHQVLVYPNPFENLLTIELPETNGKSYFVEILDYLGRKVVEERIISQATYQINLGDRAGKGIYSLRILNDKKQVIHQQRIVKM